MAPKLGFVPRFNLWLTDEHRQSRKHVALPASERAFRMKIEDRWYEHVGDEPARFVAGDTWPLYAPVSA